jgi:hypothetical protein
VLCALRQVLDSDPAAHAPRMDFFLDVSVTPQQYGAVGCNVRSQRRAHKQSINMEGQLAEGRPAQRGAGRAHAHLVGDGLAHNNKIPLILPVA